MQERQQGNEAHRIKKRKEKMETISNTTLQQERRRQQELEREQSTFREDHRKRREGPEVKEANKE
jgi:hypothetical protein